MGSAEIRCAWTRTVDPTDEPVDLAELKLHARIFDANSDAVLSSMLVTARQEAEDVLGRGLLTQTWRLELAGFANVIPLPMAAPLQSVTSIQYYDGDGTLQSLSTSVYDTDTTTRPGRVVLKPGQSWPSVQCERENGVVLITYVVGWTTAAMVPERIKQGIKQYVTFLDMDRDGLAGGDARLAAHRCWSDRVEWIPPRWFD